jgi:iron-sulfur cluster assembly accessory protein
LRKSEEKYRMLSEITSDAASSTIINKDGTLTREWTVDKILNKYGFTFDEIQQADDLVIEQACSSGDTHVKLLVDPMSLQYLKQAEIDYVNNIQGEQFVIRNPNAKTTCGCGSSFSVEDEDE